MKETNETLLFLHGFPFSPAMWELQRAAFEAKGYRVVAPDLRLEGEIGPDGLPAPATMERMAEAALAALDEAGAAQSVVCGLSMGGYAALALYALAPERVNGLVLTDTRAEADSEEGRAGRRAVAEKAMAQGGFPDPDALLSKLVSPATKADKPDVVDAIRRMILEASPAAIASAALGMAVRPDRTALLPTIRVPALVIVGEHDSITPPDAARAMASAIPGSELVVLTDAGHVSNMEQPERFNRALLDWLSSGTR